MTITIPDMPVEKRPEAELAIRFVREELNRSVEHKTSYDAENHNICLAWLVFKNGRSDFLAAYSNDTAVPESARLHLNLVPSLYQQLSQDARYGCNGMAQYHTEPKLLNWLCAKPNIRQSAWARRLPKPKVYRQIIEKQRQQATASAALLSGPQDLVYLGLITEIDCCTTCVDYSLLRFRSRFPDVQLEKLELGKKVSAGVPPKFEHSRVERS